MASLPLENNKRWEFRTVGHASKHDSEPRLFVACRRNRNGVGAILVECAIIRQSNVIDVWSAFPITAKLYSCRSRKFKINL